MIVYWADTVRNLRNITSLQASNVLAGFEWTSFYSVSQYNACVPFLSSDAQLGDGQRKPSFNGELNGLLGTAGLLGSTDRSTMSESTRPISTDISSAQESQIM